MIFLFHLNIVDIPINELDISITNIITFTECHDEIITASPTLSGSLSDNNNRIPLNCLRLQILAYFYI